MKTARTIKDSFLNLGVRGKIPLIAVDEMHKRQARGEKFLIIDVREKSEFDGPDGRIPGAVSVPFLKAIGKAPGMIDQASEPAILVCRKGLRSWIALALSGVRGRDVYSLKGGMKAWNKRGFEVVGKIGRAVTVERRRREKC